jgi:3-phenylpropionate/trans-cinnamate dioxygenase ferredoxin reductase subunit
VADPGSKEKPVTTKRIVIVGAGLAGAKTAEALRDEGFDGTVTLIGDERHRPYERPPLSKEYLTGKADQDSVYVHPSSWYADNGVDLRAGVAATGVDRAAHQVVLADGDRVAYDKLLLATGSSARTLPGTDGLLYLRRIEDADRIRKVIDGGGHLVVIGGGWIGLEVAAAARQAGVRVTVVETLELPLLRVLGPEIARVFADLHTDHGVDLRLGVAVERITPGTDGTSVRLTDGTTLDADGVVVGIGAAPNTHLAEQAGLDVRDGIVVDSSLRSSDPDILAAGDVASARHPLLGRHVRVEHWANALNQPAVAAATMLGADAAYDELPYFFTDQYDLGMEYLGHAVRYDRVVVRGDLATRQFVAFWLAEGRVTAGMNVNLWDVTEDVKLLIRSGTRVNPDALADPETALDQVKAW